MGRGISPSNRMLQEISLVLLALQSASLTLLMKHAARSSSNAGSIVFMVEMVKLVASFLLEMFGCQQGNPLRVLTAVYNDVVEAPMDCLSLLVPALLYALQNRLSFEAMRHLSALNFQLVYQARILTTALFSMLLLGRQLRPRQWAALLLLLIGIVLVQLRQTAGSTSEGGSQIKGMLILGFNSVSSGFAGVYFERLSKRSGRSLWIQSIQLGLLSLPITLSMALQHGIALDGFFRGYDRVTWTVITLQSLGGMIVSVVMRYADGIQKAFATSLSILLCSLISVGWMGEELSGCLMAGTSLVTLAILLYASSR